MAAWQIRDLAHGKVFSFDSWDELEAWVSDKVYQMFPCPDVPGGIN